jgi:hypothetical protein
MLLLIDQWAGIAGRPKPGTSSYQLIGYPLVLFEKRIEAIIDTLTEEIQGGGRSPEFSSIG